MFFILRISLFVFLTQTLSASITIPNGTYSDTLIQLIDGAANNYFKPLEENQKDQAIQARLARSDNLKAPEDKADPAKPAVLKDTAQPAKDKEIQRLEKFADQQDQIKKICFDYCEYIVESKKNKPSASIQDVLKEPLLHFWQSNSIEALCNLDNFFTTLMFNTAKMQHSLQSIKISQHDFGTKIHKTINITINMFRQKCKNKCYAQIAKFYQMIELGKKVSPFTVPDIHTDYETIWIDMCKDFFEKTFELNSHVLNKDFFDSILQTFQSHLLANNTDFSTALFTPNPTALELFFESIIAHQILFNGCSDYIQSLSGQQYPDSIKGKLIKDVLDEAVHLYQSWLDGSRNVNDKETLDTIQQNAMTEVSSIYKNTIEEKIKATNPHMPPDVRDNLATYFQTALFSNIDFENYPELDATFNQAFEDCDLNNPTHNNQAAINQLVRDAHAIAIGTITPTQWHHFSKWIEKKYYARKNLIMALVIIISFFVIINTLKKIRGFY